MNSQTLKEVYLYVFDNHAVDTLDVMEHFSITRAEALRYLVALDAVKLVGGEYTDGNGTISSDRKRFPGTNKLWQCWESQDAITRDVAVDRFELIFSEKGGAK